jgi:hypothetical protein
VNPSDLSVFKARLTELAEALQAKPPTDIAMKAWFLALRDIPLTTCVDSLDEWTCTKPRYPSPSDVRQLASAKISARIEEQAKVDRSSAGTLESVMRAGAAALRDLSPEDQAVCRKAIEACWLALKRAPLVKRVPLSNDEVEARMEREAIQAEGRA